MMILLGILVGLVGGVIEYEGKKLDRAGFISKCKELDIRKWDVAVKTKVGKAFAMEGILDEASETKNFSLAFKKRGELKQAVPIRFTGDTNSFSSGMALRVFGILTKPEQEEAFLDVRAWVIPEPTPTVQALQLVPPTGPLMASEVFTVRGMVRNENKLYPVRRATLVVTLTKGNRSSKQKISVENLVPGEVREVEEQITLSTRVNQGSNRLPEVHWEWTDLPKPRTDENP